MRASRLAGAFERACGTVSPPDEKTREPPALRPQPRSPLLLRLKHQQVRHRFMSLAVLEVAEVFAVEPDRVRLARLQLYRQYARALVGKIVRLAGGLGEVLFTQRGPGPASVLHV